MQKLKDIWQKTPWYIKNPYFLMLFVFAIWMTFFDKHNLFDQIESSQKINELNDKKEYYATQITDTEKLQEELFSTDESKEKFARETYFMKKENEDVFIIVNDDEE